jgi:hypothetical protein
LLRHSEGESSVSEHAKLQEPSFRTGGAREEVLRVDIHWDT